MSGNTFGHLFAVTNFGESHGPAIGCVIDGCPPGLPLSASDIQPDLDRRRPGTSKFVTQRNEPDQVEILSGVYQGLTTGTPIALLIRNTDQRSKDYGDIEQTFRPGHADYTYWHKYGSRDPRGGGRSSARLTAPMVAAGAVAKKWLSSKLGVAFQGCMTQIGDQLVLKIGHTSLKTHFSRPSQTPLFWKTTYPSYVNRATRVVRLCASQRQACPWVWDSRFSTNSMQTSLTP
jgi:chorismate synthase